MSLALIGQALKIVASNKKFVETLKNNRAFDMATKWASRNLLNEPRFKRHPKNPRKLLRVE